MENGHEKKPEMNGETTECDSYEKKFICLSRRCATIQQNNEKLVNRLIHLKKMIRRVRRERRFLMRRLDQHEDNYRDIPLMLPVPPEMEDDSNLGIAAPPDFPLSPPPLSMPIASTAAPIIRQSSGNGSTPLFSTVSNSAMTTAPSVMWSAAPESTTPTGVSGAAVMQPSSSPCTSSSSSSKKKTNVRSSNSSEKSKEKGNGKQKSSFLIFPQEQRNQVVDKFLNSDKDEVAAQNGNPKRKPKSSNSLSNEDAKGVYDLYDGDDNAWAYGPNEDLSLPQTGSPAISDPKRTSLPKDVL